LPANRAGSFMENKIQNFVESISDTEDDIIEEENKNDLNDEVNKNIDKTENNKSPNKSIVEKPNKYDEYELYTAYCLLSEGKDPKTYNEAIILNEWKEAINKEIESLNKFNTFTLTDLPNNVKAIDTRWVFKTKQDGTKKARLVAKGYQEETFNNVYSPVAKMPTIRMFLSHALQNQ